MRKILIIATSLGLAACAKPPPAQQAAVSNLIVSAATVAALNSTTAAALVQKGAILCGEAATSTGQLQAGAVIMLANAAGVPVTVTDQSTKAVADACKLIGMVPGGLPPGTDPASIPVVESATTLPSAI